MPWEYLLFESSKFAQFFVVLYRGLIVPEISSYY